MAAAVAAGGAGRAADWPQFGGPGRNMVSPERGLLRAWPAGGPRVLWTVPLGEGYGGAAVVGRDVYLLDRDDKDILKCLDLGTGAVQWTFAYEAPGKLAHPGSRQVPTVSAASVFTIGPFGHLHGVDRATHRPVWKRHLLEDWGGALPRWGVAQAPLLYKDAVIVAPQSGSVGLVALDQATGRERWRSGPIGAMRYVSPTLVSVAGADQVVMQSGSEVAGLDASTGKILWTYKYACRNAIPHPTPVGDGGFFITGGYDAGSDLVRVVRAGGGFAVRRLWRHPDMGSQIHQPFLIQGFLYALCNTNDRADGMACFASDGTVRWQTKRDPYLCRGNGILTGDGLLYQMDGASGELYILEPRPEGFRALSKAPLLGGREIWAPMALSDGKLVLRDQHQMKCIQVRGPPEL
jgi:outer membrane protein assembly factor BamB